MKRTVLGLAFLLGAACTEDDPALSNDAAVVNVEVLADRFNPETLTIKPGQTVRWTWKGGEHNVVSGACDGDNSDPDGVFRSGAPQGGGTFDRLFSVKGSFPYYCELHCSMGMKGEIKVE